MVGAAKCRADLLLLHNSRCRRDVEDSMRWNLHFWEILIVHRLCGLSRSYVQSFYK